jgi:hypothetical protein
MSSGAFAGMKLYGDKDKIVYDPHYPALEAEIVGADYFYYKGQQMVAVSFYDSKKLDKSGQPLNVNVEVIFTDGDIPFGLALSSKIGNPATIYFANAHFDIEQFHVRKNYSKNPSAFKTFPRFQMPRN